MSAVASVAWVRPRRTRAITAGVSLVALVALAVLFPAAAARGWLAGWLLAMMPCVGASVLILIHQLTGGIWRGAGEPWLSRLALLTPQVAMGGIPVMLSLGLIYPWAVAPGEGSVATLWLVPWLFGVRGLCMLAIWSGLGLVAPRAPGPAVAAVGLGLYGVTITVASIDWVLSLDPGFTSTDFAATMAISQLAAALALGAVLGLRLGKAAGDWGGLLLATVLGVFYLSAMQFLVSWSGDLPSKAAWYAARGGPAGAAIIDVAFVVGACLPVAILLPSALRRAPGALRGAGAAVLFGTWLHLLWLTAPMETVTAPLVAAGTSLLAAALFATLLAGPATSEGEVR